MKCTFPSETSWTVFSVCIPTSILVFWAPTRITYKALFIASYTFASLHLQTFPNSSHKPVKCLRSKWSGLFRVMTLTYLVLIFCVNQFFHHCNQIPEKNNFQRARIILLIFLVVKVHRDREDRIKISLSCHSSQESEKRERLGVTYYISVGIFRLMFYMKVIWSIGPSWC
jgi:hypothetical protein